MSDLLFWTLVGAAAIYWAVCFYWIIWTEETSTREEALAFVVFGWIVMLMLPFAAFMGWFEKNFPPKPSKGFWATIEDWLREPLRRKPNRKA